MMRRETTANTGCLRGAMELTADPGGRARQTACATAQDAKQRTGGQSSPQLEPRLELCPSPAVDPDLATLLTLAVTHKHRAAVRITVSLADRERLIDPQAGAPQHDDHAAQPNALGTVAGGTHHSDDLLHSRWVGWVPKALVARRGGLGGSWTWSPVNGAARRSPAAVGIP
jgi:hypothetical protein